MACVCALARWIERYASSRRRRFDDVAKNDHVLVGSFGKLKRDGLSGGFQLATSLTKPCNGMTKVIDKVGCDIATSIAIGVSLSNNAAGPTRMVLYKVGQVDDVTFHDHPVITIIGVVVTVALFHGIMTRSCSCCVF